MTTLTDATIDALRATHDELAGEVAGLTTDQLTGPSGASEWTVAQVLSHLGSGAEIGLATFEAALAGAPAPGQEFNQGVWDRWNAMAPADQAAGFVEHDEALVQRYEATGADQRDTLRVALGFAPAPLTLAGYAGIRLNETALHSWDVRVALDPAAGVDATAAELLAEHFAGELGFLLGFIGKADQLPQPAVVDVAGTGYRLELADRAALTSDADTVPTATFAGPLEAVVRLIGGRLGPRHTAPDVVVSGTVTLDDLRAVFPGY